MLKAEDKTSSQLTVPMLKPHRMTGLVTAAKMDDTAQCYYDDDDDDDDDDDSTHRLKRTC